MTPEQQRLHEQHKARLARIQGRAYHPPETAKACPTSVEKFNGEGRGFPRVGNAGYLVGAGHAASDAQGGRPAKLEAGHALPQVQGEHASQATRTSKSAAGASTEKTGRSPWFRVAGTLLTVRDIQDAVIAHFRMPRVELFAKRRNKATVRRRHIAIYLSKILTIQSLPEIGMRFGGLDHTTILYASRKIERALHQDAELAQDVAEIERGLTALEETRT